MKRLCNSPLAAFALFCVLTLSAIGCGAILSALPIVTRLVTDATLVLDTIHNYVDTLEGVSEPHKADVQSAIERARQALSVAKEAAKGAQDLSDVRLDAALAAFRAAYEQVLALTKPLGVKESAGLFGAMPGGDGLVVPDYKGMRAMAIAESKQ